MHLDGTLLDGISPEHKDCVARIEDGRLYVSTSQMEEWSWGPNEVLRVKNQNGQIRITLENEQEKGNHPVLIVKYTDETLRELEYLTGKRYRALPAGQLIPLVLGGVAATATLIMLLVNNIWRFVPTDVDILLGNSLRPSLLEQFGNEVVEHSQMQQFLEDGIHKLKNPHSPFVYNITIFNSSIENAFALPGGQMFISSELIKESETPEEVLGILAHEIAHVEKRHGMQNVSRAAGIVFVISTTVGIVGGLEEFEMAEALLEFAAILPMMHYSRKMETEADEIALKKLHRERISAQGMHDFFARMTHDHGDIEETIPGWLSTHPASSKRMRSIQQHIDTEPQYKPILTKEQWKQLKSQRIY